MNLNNKKLSTKKFSLSTVDLPESIQSSEKKEQVKLGLPKHCTYCPEDQSSDDSIDVKESSPILEEDEEESPESKIKQRESPESSQLEFEDSQNKNLEQINEEDELGSEVTP